MRISDWSSDGCSSDLPSRQRSGTTDGFPRIAVPPRLRNSGRIPSMDHGMTQQPITLIGGGLVGALLAQQLAQRGFAIEVFERSEEHTSELQSLMRISYAVFCLKKNKHTTAKTTTADVTCSK